MESQHAQACLPSRLQFSWASPPQCYGIWGPPPCGETALCPVHVTSIPGLTFSCQDTPFPTLHLHFQMSACGQSPFLRCEATGSMQWTLLIETQFSQESYAGTRA